VGVLEGAAIGTPSGFVAGGLAGLICGPGAWLCVPVGALVGGAAGLVGGGAYAGITKGQNAVPESTAAEIRTTLAGVIADRDLQADLRQQVLKNADGAPMGVDLGTGAAAPVVAPDYSTLGERVGTVLEISLTQLALAGKGGTNPTLTLVIAARARLIRIADHRVLWSAEEVRHESPPALFTLWRVRNSDLLKAEIDDGLEAVARQIGQALFVPPGAVALNTGIAPA
jgi:hypothetical protein